MKNRGQTLTPALSRGERGSDPPLPAFGERAGVRGLPSGVPAPPGRGRGGGPEEDRRAAPPPAPPRGGGGISPPPPPLGGGGGGGGPSLGRPCPRPRSALTDRPESL